MLDRLTGMRVFARAAGLGSLSAAARSLGMSQTMATKHLDALEHGLGVKLVHRTTRKLTFTEPGRRYLDSVERILAEIDEADATAAAERFEVTGRLRVAVPVSFGAREIAPLVGEICGLHPGLTVELGLNDRTVDLVDEGWDMAVRVGELSDERLVARRLAPCGMAVAAAPSYLSARGTPKTIADLQEHNCLGYTLSGRFGPHRWPFGPKGEVAASVAGNLLASNGDALVAAAVAGLGIIYQPTFLLAEPIRGGRLVPLVLDRPPLDLAGVFAVYPGGRRPPAKVRAFVDFLALRWAPTAPWELSIPYGRRDSA